MNTLQRTILGATLLAATAAQAALVHFDHDPADLVNLRASFFFGAMNWSQEVMGDDVAGQLTGQLIHHGVVPGCAKVRAIWRNEAGQEISHDISSTACSRGVLNSVRVGVDESFRSGKLRSARVELLLQEGNGEFRIVESRAMRAGGG